MFSSDFQQVSPEEAILQPNTVRTKTSYIPAQIAVAGFRGSDSKDKARLWLWISSSLVLAILLLLATQVAVAAWVRPLEGSGNFHTMIDVYNRWRSDGNLDVILLFSVANSEVKFISQSSKYKGSLRITAELEGTDGTKVSGEKTVTLLAHHPDDLNSVTLQQVFPLILSNVTSRQGRIYCVVEDLHTKREGLYNVIKNKRARSEAAGDWEAPEPRRRTTHLSVNDPIFMAHAPSDLQDETGTLNIEQAAVFHYLHPSRRYGLEQDHLQVYFEVDPPLASRNQETIAQGLRVQVLAKDLEFAMNDTIVFDPDQKQTLASGGVTGIYYELDVNQLPPGAYQLNCAATDAEGRGWVAEFDVIWNLNLLNRHRDELLGEGRTVLRGQQLKDFLDAGQAEQEIMLEAFWNDLDPNPSTSLNESYVEFRRRVAYVRERLGGFGQSGAVDPRGYVFLLLGQPTEIQIESMPLNTSDQEDAYVKVYDRFAPDREGTQIKGFDPTLSDQPWRQEGGIPQDYTYQARRDIHARRTSSRMYQAFELWKYNHSGRHLFPNQYSEQSLGLQFLFVDRNGTGRYVLETSNAYDHGVSK